MYAQNCIYKMKTSYIYMKMCKEIHQLLTSNGIIVGDFC